MEVCCFHRRLIAPIIINPRCALSLTLTLETPMWTFDQYIIIQNETNEKMDNFNTHPIQKRMNCGPFDERMKNATM